MSKTGYKILIVEDNLAQAESLGLILQSMGHRLLLCGSGEQGMEQIKVHGFPAGVILDLLVPGMGGEAFLTWMRGHPALENTPVVVMTGLPVADYAELEQRPNIRVLQKGSAEFRQVLDAFAGMGLDLERRDAG